MQSGACLVLDSTQIVQGDIYESCLQQCLSRGKRYCRSWGADHYYSNGDMLWYLMRIAFRYADMVANALLFISLARSDLPQNCIRKVQQSLRNVWVDRHLRHQFDELCCQALMRVGQSRIMW